MRAAVEHDVMAEREQIITQVESTLGEVSEIFSELGSLVNEQGVHIDHISSAIENTASQTSFAADELFTASRAQNKLRSRTCCFAGALLVSVVLILVIGLTLRV